MLVRCLHCHEPIELVDDSDLRHVACPSCGGSFNLVGEDTLSWSAETTKHLGPFERLAVGRLAPSGKPVIHVWTGP